MSPSVLEAPRLRSSGGSAHPAATQSSRMQVAPQPRAIPSAAPEHPPAQTAVSGPRREAMQVDGPRPVRAPRRSPARRYRLPPPAGREASRRWSVKVPAAASASQAT